MWVAFGRAFNASSWLVLKWEYGNTVSLIPTHKTEGNATCLLESMTDEDGNSLYVVALAAAGVPSVMKDNV